MKIGITCYPTYGGSGVVATELGKSLAKRGHSIHFISYAIPMRLESFVENIFYHEVEMSNYPLFEFQLYSLAVTSKMVEVAKYERLDILHVHYAIPHATSAFLAKQIIKQNIPKVITTLHGTDITLVGLEPSFLPLMKFSIEQSDGVTAVSHFLKKQTEANYDIEKDIKVIHNFIDTDHFKKAENILSRKCIASDEEKVLIHVSNFRTVKRVMDVIKVFAIIKTNIPSKLVLVGDGPDRSECENLCRELKICDHVKFLGKQSALVDILSIADLFIMPSQSESFGLAALEAMSCGLPVIASNIGGLPELLVHEKTGYLSEMGDIEAMARYALELLLDKDKYIRFSNESRKRAEKIFSIDIITKEYEDFYNEILSK
jgi:N-acetyl-alpha-D-glucosaminyl L-malate synthase BshA